MKVFFTTIKRARNSIKIGKSLNTSEKYTSGKKSVIRYSGLVINTMQVKATVKCSSPIRLAEVKCIIAEYYILEIC